MKERTPAPRLQTPQGSFQLGRYPARANETLLAWCSADSLLLEEVQRCGIPGPKILVVNDAYGALCVALQPQALWTDSALAVHALRYNEHANCRIPTPVIRSTQTPALAVPLVVMRIPKNTHFLEFQLRQLAGVLPPGSTVLAAGMDKHLSPHTAQILERHVGPTQRHRGRSKARLFSSVRDTRPAPACNDTVAYHCEALDAELQSFANVFSRDRLDPGTRLLLGLLHQLPPVESLIDLACGNGVLGLVAARMGLAQKLSFCDESAMAIASAQLNARHLLPELMHNFNFYQGDGLSDYDGQSVQLILCNPPFHSEHTVDEFAGRHLLKQCSDYLQPGGSLCLVANRHLNYLPTLRQAFRQVEQIAGNAKFNVLLAQKK